MKVRLSFLLLFLFFSTVFADEQVNIKLSTSATCSPAIGINNGKVVINCTTPEIEAKVRSLPDLSDYNSNISQLSNLVKTSSKLSGKIYQLEKSNQASSADLNQLSSKLRIAEIQYTELFQKHVQLSSKLAAELAKTPEIIEKKINALTPEITTTLAESIFDQQIQKHTKSIFFKVKNNLISQRIRLDNLENRVYALETDVSFLMNEYLHGRLHNYVGFFGLSVGGLYISEEWPSRIGIEYELLLPKTLILSLRSSLYFELAKLNWTKTQEYQTLPGIDPIRFINSHELNILNLGARLFFHQWTDNVQSYLVSSFGHSFASNEDTYSYNLGIGTEYFRSSTRIALELRWEGYSDIHSEKIIFNPLGDASITSTSENRNGWFAGIKISFR